MLCIDVALASCAFRFFCGKEILPPAGYVRELTPNIFVTLVSYKNEHQHSENLLKFAYILIETQLQSYCFRGCLRRRTYCWT